MRSVAIKLIWKYLLSFRSPIANVFGALAKDNLLESVNRLSELSESGIQRRSALFGIARTVGSMNDLNELMTALDNFDDKSLKEASAMLFIVPNHYIVHFS